MITVPQASILYGVTTSRVRQWIRENKLEAIKLGRDWRILPRQKRPPKSATRRRTR